LQYFARWRRLFVSDLVTRDIIGPNLLCLALHRWRIRIFDLDPMWRPPGFSVARAAHRTPHVRWRPNSTGNLAIFTAIRRASSPEVGTKHGRWRFQQRRAGDRF
jgi:hypothetical protein